MEIFKSLHIGTQYEFLLENAPVVEFAKKLFTSRKDYHFIQLSELPQIFVQIKDANILLNHLTNPELSYLFNVKGKKADMISVITINPEFIGISSKIGELKGGLYRFDVEYETFIFRRLITMFCIRDTRDLSRIFLFPDKAMHTVKHSLLNAEYADAILLLDTAQRVLDPTHERYRDIGECKIVYVNHLMQHIEARFPLCKPHPISYLSRYSVGDIYTKILLLCVPIVDHLIQYKIFGLLLEQKNFRVDSRGKWYIEAAKLLEYHNKTIKMSEKVSNLKILTICERGIKDEFCHNIEKIILSKKAEKLQHKLNTIKSTRVKFKMNLRIAPEIKIIAKIAKNKLRNRPLYYKIEESEAVLVEPFVLQYYKNLGYRGLHCESKIFSLLFGFFMHHILMLDTIPNVFVHEYQQYPLDLYSTEFFRNRTTEIMEWVVILEMWSADRIARYIKRNSSRFSTGIIGLELLVDQKNNEKMDLDDFIFICTNFGGKVIANICKYISYNYRRNLSGGPDLLVWNDTEVKMIEVKGVNDTLQVNQQIWASHLVESGAPIYTLYVNTE